MPSNSIEESDYKLRDTFLCATAESCAALLRLSVDKLVWVFVCSIECYSFNESNWGKLKKKRKIALSAFGRLVGWSVVRN